MGGLAAAVDELVKVDLHGLSGPDLGERLVEVHRQVNRVQAEYLRMLEVFDRTGAALASHGSTQAWVRDELNLSPGPAVRDVHLARDLADVLPATRAALAAGDISPEHAQLIASLKRAVNPEALAAAEPHVAEAAKTTNPKDLRAVIAHVRSSYAPDKHCRDDAADYDARRLDVSTTIHGTGVGSFALHAHGQETLMAAIHAASRPVNGDQRTAKQRRADALITIAELALKSGNLPNTGGVKPHVTLDALTGAENSPAATFTFGGTTSAEWAKRVSCDASIARVVFGPASEPLDVGRSMRTFTAAQTRAIIARDRTCIWPGCDTPAPWCECHHTPHWGDGGHTSVQTGVLVCGRHHDQIHAHGHGHQITTTTDGHHTVNPRPATDPHWRGHPHRAGP